MSNKHRLTIFLGQPVRALVSICKMQESTR